ncbi:MAG: ABC transporter ATP-binding protein [Actinobacteria bacterium]|nr:ABC transporter ATP-binding protein [Actinomycetota bacterium]
MSAVSDDEQLDAEAARRLLRRCWRMLDQYRLQLVGALALVVLYTLATVAGPYLVKLGIDRAIRKGDGSMLDKIVLAYVGVAAIGFLSNRAQVMVLGRVGENFLRDMRVRVFDHLLRLSMPFYDREKAGVVVSRMTSDVDSLQELVQMGLIQFLSSLLLIVVSVVALFFVSWQLMLICLIPLPFVVVASIKFQRDSNRAYLTIRDRIGNMLSMLQEGIAGVRVIQAFSREDVQTGRFGRRNRTLYDAHMRSVKIQAWYLPVIEFAGTGTTALVMGIGGWLAVRNGVRAEGSAAGGAVTVGTVAFFVLSLSNLFEPVQQLSQLFNTVQSAGAGLNKLFGLMDTEVDLVEPVDPVALPAEGAIVVDRVSFAYTPGGERVLRDVSLTVAPGERLALVGPTGAGKSTLAKLMARLYDPTEGTITFGGVDLRAVATAELRRQIVVVPQEGFLFNGTIRDNVRLGRAGAGDAEVEDALEAIGARERFAALPAGLDTEVRERGSRLSAGEKQLVSLARAALADPTVLVLDEATSSLDPGTEALVEQALERLMVGRTVIVIAHRLSTSERADRVGVVLGGRLVELGTHDELVAAGGAYASLYDTWIRGLAAASSPG